MDKIEAIKKSKEFADLIKNRLDLSKVILFGSYINEKNSEISDIDIAVIVKSLDGNYLSNLNLLYKLRKKIDLLIEPVLFIEGKDPSGFLEFIEKNGLIVYHNQQ
ncbi:MAG: nucleotidyltransferase domain-containing protein [Candidatus Kapabacteria bacterium]|nr:nucleotidyltransferase domain-containing protein [Candidatus Kapabacteria bacterium]